LLVKIPEKTGERFQLLTRWSSQLLELIAAFIRTLGASAPKVVDFLSRPLPCLCSLGFDLLNFKRDKSKLAFAGVQTWQRSRMPGEHKRGIVWMRPRPHYATQAGGCSLTN
jgi:hypothetical protein